MEQLKSQFLGSDFHIITWMSAVDSTNVGLRVFERLRRLNAKGTLNQSQDSMYTLFSPCRDFVDYIHPAASLTKIQATNAIVSNGQEAGLQGLLTFAVPGILDPSQMDVLEASFAAPVVVIDGGVGESCMVWESTVYKSKFAPGLDSVTITETTSGQSLNAFRRGIFEALPAEQVTQVSTSMMAWMVAVRQKAAGYANSDLMEALDLVKIPGGPAGFPDTLKKLLLNSQAPRFLRPGKLANQFWSYIASLPAEAGFAISRIIDLVMTGVQVPALWEPNPILSAAGLVGFPVVKNSQWALNHQDEAAQVKVFTFDWKQVRRSTGALRQPVESVLGLVNGCMNFAAKIGSEQQIWEQLWFDYSLPALSAQAMSDPKFADFVKVQGKTKLNTIVKTLDEFPVLLKVLSLTLSENATALVSVAETCSDLLETKGQSEHLDVVPQVALLADAADLCISNFKSIEKLCDAAFSGIRLLPWIPLPVLYQSDIGSTTIESMSWTMLDPDGDSLATSISNLKYSISLFKLPLYLPSSSVVTPFEPPSLDAPLGVSCDGHLCLSFDERVLAVVIRESLNTGLREFVRDNGPFDFFWIPKVYDLSVKKFDLAWSKSDRLSFVMTLGSTKRKEPSIVRLRFTVQFKGIEPANTLRPPWPASVCIPTAR
jgi:hypothetical protein